MRPRTLAISALLGAVLATAVALAAVAEQRVVYRPARYALRPGCTMLVSRDECRRVIVQPRLVRVWAWGKFTPTLHWTDWGDWG